MKKPTYKKTYTDAHIYEMDAYEEINTRMDIYTDRYMHGGTYK